jgi:hypothetical protein
VVAFARNGGAAVASIVPFIPPGVFDDATTKAMGEAFDTACEALHDRGQPTVVYEVLARRIIAAARKGERDVGRLRNVALKALARSKRTVE